ncbi:hypothetical protein LBMAG15_09930 [Actinomycetes bacterium]|nr:hypothetical protein LBMAG15_09930 [Actinomycetes bacterium]
MGPAKIPKAQDGSDQADSQWPDPTPEARCGHWLAKAVGEGFNVTPGGCRRHRYRSHGRHRMRHY